MAPRGREEEQVLNEPPSPGGEEEEEETMETTTARSKRRKAKKLKMGEESGLTEEQRRAIRHAQRELNNTVAEGPVEDDEEFLVKAREKNNELFEDSRFSRELFLDAENLDLIAAKSVKKVEEKVKAPRYDENLLLRKLQGKCSGKSAQGYRFFDWYTLGGTLRPNSGEVVFGLNLFSFAHTSPF